MADLDQHLYAAMLAADLNIGPTRMAECCPLTYRQLAWATEWYLGDDQLQAANDVLEALRDFREQVIWHGYRALRRRSQCSGMTWERMRRLAKRWLPTVRILHPWPPPMMALP